MRDYVIRRILLLFVTLILGSIVVFTALRTLPPEDAIDLQFRRVAADGATQAANEERADAQRKALGIYGPLHEQYLRWAQGFVTGDWGRSMITQRSIFEELKHRIPVSIELSLIALVVTWCVSFPLGVLAAIRQDKFADYFLRTGAYALDALPAFVLGILLLTYLAVTLNWAPPVRFVHLWDDPMRHTQMMILPAFVIGVTSAGNLLRFTRTFLLEVMRQDYIRTARSKGLSEKQVIMRHALRNFALPLVTVIGATVPLLLTSSAIIENLFSLPGMGRYLVGAAGSLDYPVVMTTTMFYGIIILTTQLLTDLSYAWLDPRVSYSRGA